MESERKSDVARISPTISYISIDTVLPEPASQTEEAGRVELTPWELLPLRLHHMQMGMLFLKPQTTQEQVSALVDHLKTSFARTLHYFPPLAGRIAMDRHEDDTISFYVDCKAVGAQFVHASVDVTIDYVLDPVEVPPLVISFFPCKGVVNYEGTQPLLGVQVTELVDGIFIGVSMNHVMADGKSLWHFINAWSAISRSSDNTPPLPIFKRWFQNEADLPIRFPSSFEGVLKEKDPEPILSERAFLFTSQKVAQLKEIANKENAPNRISTLQTLLGHVWITITRARNLDPNELVICGIAAGNRARLDPPLPDEYFGNPVGVVTATAKAGELLENGLGWAAGLLNQAVKTYTDAGIRNSWDNYIKKPELLYPRKVPPNLLSSGSSPLYDIYGNDFGWGRPIALETLNSNYVDGVAAAHPGTLDGSMDIHIFLPPQALKAIDYTEFTQVSV